MGTRPHNVYRRSNNAPRTRCPEANAYGHVYDRDDAYVTLLVVDRDHECSWRDVGRSIGTVRACWRGLEAPSTLGTSQGHREADYGSSTLTSSKTAVATTAELWLVTTRLLLDGDIDRVTVPNVTHVTPSLDVWPV